MDFFGEDINSGGQASKLAWWSTWSENEKASCLLYFYTMYTECTNLF